MKRKILVVDDNDDIIFSVKAGLEDIQPDFEVIGINNGKKCLKEFSKIKPDLVLLDVMMPEMNGWVVNKNLKMLPEAKNVPVIFLTALTDNVSKQMGKHGAADFIEKPFDITDLAARINAVLDRK
ncbi:chemotaxis protein CheY [Candidatus Woesearchaeota archaeon CG11_big_fil_rev_8_21_14_0_20_43_8]|nr:MAG: chemotaxis protein CheY [Candidatus Woesearchaeota archaeon CG11_big_fil_rev_8_21_14_0_20_43_8]PIO06735.1 MAG: chemotaxis protein CheY [Candidatus Woesearchaeota archaeon CG08_land_8_20_14_0_20_43_7]